MDRTESQRARRRACIVVHARYPVGEPRAERAAHALRDAGYEVHVVALRGAGEPARETCDGIDVRRLPLAKRRGRGVGRMLYEYPLFTALAALAVAGLGLRRRLDVVQVHGPPDFLVLAGLAPRLRGATLVLDIRDITAHLWDARYGATRAAALARALIAVERASCALADRVVTVHEPYRRELVSHGVAPDKVEVVMNSPDPRLIERVRGAAGPPANGGFTVGYHGTVAPWYGVDLLVEALARLRESVPQARGVVLGEGDDLARVRDVARELGVAGRIEFSGRHVPIEEALRTVSRADCGVMPNRRTLLNGFILSNKLLEYIALGMPVVVAELETVGAHFGPDEVTFFEPDDPESLADALRWVAEHPEEARTKAARARERAEAYGWEANRRRYLALLDEAACR